MVSRRGEGRGGVLEREGVCDASHLLVRPL